MVEKKLSTRVKLKDENLVSQGDLVCIDNVIWSGSVSLHITNDVTGYLAGELSPGELACVLEENGESVINGVTFNRVRIMTSHGTVGWISRYFLRKA